MRLNKKNIYYGGLRRKLRESNKTSIDSFNEFINMVSVNSELTNAILLIGISYSYSRNLNREIEDLQPDFCWTEDSTNSEYSNAKNSPKNQWYQLFFPFTINPIFLSQDDSAPLISSDFHEESNKVEQVFGYFQFDSILNKFSLIVFDSSTSKFLFPNSNIFITFPSFISYLFYYFLEVSGEIYINLKYNNMIFFSYNDNNIVLLDLIIKRRKQINELTIDSEIFGKKFIYIRYDTRIFYNKLNILTTSIKYNMIEYKIPEINKEIVQENNIEYLRRNLLGSQIQYFPNKSETKEVKENRTTHIQSEYPITKTNYPIGPFIKITKTSNFTKDNIKDFRKIFLVIYNDVIVHKMNPKIPENDLVGLNCLFI